MDCSRGSYGGYVQRVGMNAWCGFSLSFSINLTYYFWGCMTHVGVVIYWDIYLWMVMFHSCFDWFCHC